MDSLSLNEQYVRLYGKGPGMRTFKALNWKTGNPVGNLIYATVFTPAQGQQAYDEAQRLNPEWAFKVVSV